MCINNTNTTPEVNFYNEVDFQIVVVSMDFKFHNFSTLSKRYIIACYICFKNYGFERFAFCL